jgi:hypothetical protein
VDGDRVTAGVTVEVSGIDAVSGPVRLTIRLTSSGDAPTHPPEPTTTDNGCPQHINDELAA